LKPSIPLCVRYSIDDKDRIFQVNDDWLRFAAENDGGKVTPPSILGKSLWSCIEDPTLSELYQKLVEAARLGKRVRFNYRCDAPEFRRLFEMEVVGREHRTVDFISTLLDEEKRARVPLLDCYQPRSQEFVRVCSWCQRIAVGGEWLPVEAGVEALGIMQKSTLPAVSHGICNDCLVKVRKELAALVNAA
jgi:hypothetical protein